MSKGVWIFSGLLIIVAIAAGVYLAFIPGNTTVVQSTDTLSAPPTSVPSIPMISPTTPAPSPAAPAMEIDPKLSYSVTLHTSEGDIVISLDTKNTPLTSNNFYHLAKTGFYNNTIFHRVISGFMIQGGDPTGTGTGGPGYKFADEYLHGNYTRGTVAMANSGPNTNGSQFFIMHQDNPLPNLYVIFGHVTSGMDVVDKIATAPVKSSGNGESSSPVSPVSIISTDISQN